MPNPQRCMQAVNELMPILASKKMKAIMDETQDATYQLEQELSTTREYVDALTFLEEIQTRIDPLEGEAQIITGMYELMDQFNVPTPPQDVALFQTLGGAVINCRNAIDKAVSERDTNVTKLATLIDKDIEELEKEVKVIKQDVQDGAILDIKTDKKKIKSSLERLTTDMDELQSRAFSYKKYQKTFKIDVTKYEELEQVDVELRLK